MEVARGLLSGQGAAREVVVKIQAWITGRAAIGGVGFAATAEEAGALARRMLGMRIPGGGGGGGGFTVEAVLVEEKLAIARELFASLTIDDRARAPVMLFCAVGGSGIEARGAATARIACDVRTGPEAAGVEKAMGSAGLNEDEGEKVRGALRTIFEVGRSIEARSLEINPLVITGDGRVVAADCRITIDDYAVFRHPELGIEIAREFDHPATALERVAYGVEQADHRGTFYFAQVATEAERGSRGLVGFHGAGGGGSMMAMDAITNEGFTVANFTDTSGNPSAGKVYRAARIILAQPGLVGYFGSGSGVASQEQFWSAYGLAKAFWELNLDIPAVVRLGGNTEDRAVEILESASCGLEARVEGYRKGDAPALIARRFAELVVASGKKWRPREGRRPGFVGREGAVSYAIRGGRLWINAGEWGRVKGVVVAHGFGLLRDEGGRPVLAVTEKEVGEKESELIACEVECRRAGVEGVFVEIEIPGLSEAMNAGKGN